VIEETKCVGGLKDNRWGGQYHQQDRVYKGDIALAHPANIPEGSYKYIVAMGGRNPEHPTSRTAGLPTEQRLELGPKGVVNALTTVQKDNLVLENKPCYRIRKLTPKECYRLMGFSDADFDSAASVVSNTQLYKTAGNSIVKQVLMAIFRQMNIKGVKTWNEEVK
jgi:DNA (cytosine-5)-methyltransferase 1